MPSNFRTTRLARLLLLNLFLFATMPIAMAGCWRDPAVSALANQLAERLLPVVARKMPEVVVCSADAFPPNVAGIYESPGHRIRMHQNWVGTPNGTDNLIHELAHAAVWLQYGDQDRTANGHGPQWMRIMIALGRRDEAERNSWVHASSGGREALRLALSESARAPRDTGTSGECACAADRPGRAAPPPQRLTTMAAAELELQRLSQCQEVLIVPGATRGRVGYTLRSAVVRTLRPLPDSVPRVLGVRFIGPGQLELEVMPSPDGTNSLVCVG